MYVYIYIYIYILYIYIYIDGTLTVLNTIIIYNYIFT